MRSFFVLTIVGLNLISLSKRFSFYGSAVVKNSEYAVGAGLIDLSGPALDTGFSNGLYLETIAQGCSQTYS
jgi:hypothetical protein